MAPLLGAITVASSAEGPVIVIETGHPIHSIEMESVFRPSSTSCPATANAPSSFRVSDELCQGQWSSATDRNARTTSSTGSRLKGVLMDGSAPGPLT